MPSRGHYWLCVYTPIYMPMILKLPQAQCQSELKNFDIESVLGSFVTYAELDVVLSKIKHRETLIMHIKAS